MKRSLDINKEKTINTEFITPKTLIKDILDRVPSGIFMSDTTTFLDPFCGRGGFVKEIINRLKLYGHSNENILKRVYANDVSIRQVNYLKRYFDNKLKNVYMTNFLENPESINMKFDLIIGNPPYQDDTKSQGDGGTTKRKQASSKIWPAFIKKAFELKTDDGIVSMIIPTSALKGTKLKGFNFVENVKEGNISEIVVGEKSWFEGVGTRNLYFVSSANKTNTVSINNRSYNVTDFKRFIPSKNTDIAASIVAKVNKFNTRLFTNGTGGLKDISKLEMISKDDSRNKIWAGGGIGSKDLIIKDGSSLSIEELNKRFLGKPKVCLPTGCGDKIHFLWDDKGQYASGTSSEIFLLKEEDKLESVKSYLLSKVMKYIVCYQRFDGYSNHATPIIPKVSFTKEWSNSDLYQYFSFNQTEINHIEEVIK